MQFQGYQCKRLGEAWGFWDSPKPLSASPAGWAGTPAPQGHLNTHHLLLLEGLHAEGAITVLEGGKSTWVGTHPTHPVAVTAPTPSLQAHFAGILAFPDSPAPGSCGRSHTLQSLLEEGRKMELSPNALEVGA